MASGASAPVVIQTYRVRLTPEQAAEEPGSVFLTRFYHGTQNAELRFAGGEVHGRLRQGRVDDIAAQVAPISGTYTRDHLRVVIARKVFGADLSQTVDGRLVAPGS